MLKYKFIAQYDDETIFEQNDEDVSIKDSLRSAFSDVDQERLTGFALQGEGHLYVVDLLDGRFEIDGVPFYLSDAPIKNRRLIFFRRHTHQFNLEDGSEEGHTISYHLGWQGNHAETDKNIQHTIIIS